MAKFFNKEYEHAYTRGNVVWVKGTVDKEFHRISSGKPVTKANMNWVEKHWETLLRDYIETQTIQEQRQSMPTLNEYFELSLSQHMGDRRFYTNDMYRAHYRLYIEPHLGHYKLNEIKASHIKRWYGTLTQVIDSHKYALNIRSVLSTILTDALEDELISQNVVKNIRFPRKDKFRNSRKHDPDPFSLQEVLTLIDAAEGQFKHMLTFQFFTGTRPGEMISLMWSDIDWNQKKIYIHQTRQTKINPQSNKREIGPTKTGSKRHIDMLPIVERALKEQYKLTGLKDGFVFLTQKGTYYENSDFINRYYWKGLLRRTRMRYRNFYQTRHTFASIFLSEGEDLAWISKVMLGHSSIQITLNHYAKFIRQKDVVRGKFLEDLRTNNVQSEESILKDTKKWAV